MKRIVTLLTVLSLIITSIAFCFAGSEAATVVPDDAAKAYLAENYKDKSPRFTICETDFLKLNKNQRKVLDNMPLIACVTVSLECDGEEFHQLGGGSVKISIPCEIPEGKTSDDFSVYYIDEAGELKDMHAVYENGAYNITTTIFGEFVVGNPNGSTRAESDGSVNWFAMGMRAFVGLLGLAVVYFFIDNKNKENKRKRQEKGLE